MRISSKTKKTKAQILAEPRNDTLIDWWSLVHFLTGVAMGIVLNPLVALILMVLWEPFEILVLSPILANFGISFGRETLRNSLIDIVVDAAGIATGVGILAILPRLV